MKNRKVYLMDIKYSDAYNPEKMKSPKNKEFRIVYDTDGKEKLMVIEETEEIDEEKDYENKSFI